MQETERLQRLCEDGQGQLMRMEYLHAEQTLIEAEGIAWSNRDFDTLSRLYMPLQEARRQRRQRCGEGIVHLGLCAAGPDDHLSGRHVVENFPHGQLLVAGWGTIQPAQEVRQLQARHDLYVDTFLAAVYPTPSGPTVFIISSANEPLPMPYVMPEEQWLAMLPAHSFAISMDPLSIDPVRGNARTYGQVMALWERLHAPFLKRADSVADPIERIAAYRKTIEIDYACELAHQRISDVARSLCIAERNP